MKQLLELLPFFEMVNMQGKKPFGDVVREELIEEALRVGQGMAKAKQHLRGSLRTFDLKHPKGIKDQSSEEIEKEDRYHDEIEELKRTIVGSESDSDDPPPQTHENPFKT
jgi:hypothetical protein